MSVAGDAPMAKRRFAPPLWFGNRQLVVVNKHAYILSYPVSSQFIRARPSRPSPPYWIHHSEKVRPLHGQ